MSPEVLEGATEFTSFAFQQIDVYSAALVIWEVLSRTCIIDEEENNKNKEDGEIENSENIRCKFYFKRKINFLIKMK
jgi:hypothetical protein